jgi:hypothetical protein
MDLRRKDRPKTVIGEYGLKHTEGIEPVENITTRRYSRKAEPREVNAAAPGSEHGY